MWHFPRSATPRVWTSVGTVVHPAPLPLARPRCGSGSGGGGQHDLGGRHFFTGFILNTLEDFSVRILSEFAITFVFMPTVNLLAILANSALFLGNSNKT